MAKDKVRRYHELVGLQLWTFIFWAASMTVAIVVGQTSQGLYGVALASAFTIAAVARYRHLESERVEIVNFYRDPFETD